MEHMRNLLLACGSCLVALTALASPAFAQNTLSVRAGLGTDPTQGFGGVQIESPRFESNPHVTVRGIAEVGVGAQSTFLINGRLELAYFLVLPNSKWSVYVAIGPTAAFTHTD